MKEFRKAIQSYLDQRANQSRGKFNKLTDYHDTIVRLVEANAIEFQKARRKPIHKPIYQSTSQQATV